MLIQLCDRPTGSHIAISADDQSMHQVWEMPKRTICIAQD